jgi:hypothetical protein
MTMPASWTVAWAEAETQVTVTNLAAATITVAPAGPLAATITVTDAAGDDAGTLGPPDVEVIYPAPSAVIEPAD